MTRPVRVHKKDRKWARALTTCLPFSILERERLFKTYIAFLESRYLCLTNMTAYMTGTVTTVGMANIRA